MRSSNETANRCCKDSGHLGWLRLFILAGVVLLAPWGAVPDAVGANLRDAAPAMSDVVGTDTAGDPAEQEGGPDTERRFFADWHEPYGHMLPREVRDHMWHAVQGLPDESAKRAANVWEPVGPLTMVTPGGGRYTGRVLDIRWRPNHIWIAAASGGLWDCFAGFACSPMTDRVPSLAIGTFDFGPGDVVLAGTGEPTIRTGAGLWRSTDGGQIWQPFNNSGLPTTGLGRGAVAISPSNPSVMYAAWATSGGQLRGVYRSTNGGASWSDVSPPDDYLTPQGGYDNVITVSPTDPNRVFVGGVNLFTSDNGGQTWSQISSSHLNHLHADYHAFEWNPSNDLYAGHEGGWSIGDQTGAAWISTFNQLPITQYYNIDASLHDGQVMLGGAQDNGISVTHDGGSSWNFVIPRDGFESGDLSLWSAAVGG